MKFQNIPFLHLFFLWFTICAYEGKLMICITEGIQKQHDNQTEIIINKFPVSFSKRVPQSTYWTKTVDINSQALHKNRFIMSDIHFAYFHVSRTVKIDLKNLNRLMGSTPNTLDRLHNWVSQWIEMAFVCSGFCSEDFSPHISATAVQLRKQS